MPEIEPNSPEAQRAARKIRSIFLFIAALNIVIIAIVMWPKRAAQTPAAEAEPVVAATAEAKAAIAEMEAISERVIDGYTARDAERFARDFSPHAVPKPDEEYFRKVVIGLYQEEFGDFVSKKFTGETSAHPDFGMLVYQVNCKKQPKTKLSVNFRRENGVLKVMQWRMEKM